MAAAEELFGSDSDNGMKLLCNNHDFQFNVMITLSLDFILKEII